MPNSARAGRAGGAAAGGRAAAAPAAAAEPADDDDGNDHEDGVLDVQRLPHCDLLVLPNLACT